MSPSAASTNAQPTTSPTPEEVEYCKLIMLVTVEAYVDHNENGRREAWEDPLVDARFRVEWRNPKESPESDKEAFYVESDATGQAQYDVLVDCLGGYDDLGTVYAEVPPDYRLTTPDHCSTGHCIFGFAALNATPIRAREADLRGADLSGADLRGEDLRDADLTGANLRDADLRGAILRDAELSGADLQGADLREADLGEPQHLTAADLVGAKYDRDTKWPSDFDPVAAGAVLEE